MKVIITGCAGQVGQAITAHLVKSGYAVRGLDRVESFAGEIDYRSCDLLDAGPDRVVVKRGAAGAAWACRQEGSGSEPTEPIDSDNTTGAGDSFNGRLLHELSCGAPCATAVTAAVHMATEVARRGVGISGVIGSDTNR